MYCPGRVKRILFSFLFNIFGLEYGCQEFFGVVTSVKKSESCIKEEKEAKKIEGDEERIHVGSAVKEDSEVPESLRKSFPYYQYFKALKDELVKNTKVTKELNLFYCPKLVNYFVNYLGVHFPLWSATAIIRFNIYRDSNSSIENYCKLLKHSLFRNEKKVRVTTYLIKNSKFVVARNKERKIAAKTIKEDSKVQKDHKSWRKGYHRRKNKYYRQPKLANSKDLEQLKKELGDIAVVKSIKDYKEAQKLKKEELNQKKKEEEKNAANGLAKGFLSNKYLPPKKNLI